MTSTKSPIVGAHDGDLITRRIPAHLQRTGGEVRIIGADAPRTGDLTAHHLTLISAIARARHWYEQIASGNVSSMAAIARSAGLADRYVSRLLRCTLLAPDIVEALLAGTAPHDLTLAKVLRNLPPSWVRQREILGFRQRSVDKP
jgi:site-specific DNA recombinase